MASSGFNSHTRPRLFIACNMPYSALQFYYIKVIFACFNSIYPHAQTRTAFLLVIPSHAHLSRKLVLLKQPFLDVLTPTVTTYPSQHLTLKASFCMYTAKFELKQQGRNSPNPQHGAVTYTHSLPHWHPSHYSRQSMERSQYSYYYLLGISPLFSRPQERQIESRSVIELVGYEPQKKKKKKIVYRLILSTKPRLF